MSESESLQNLVERADEDEGIAMLREFNLAFGGEAARGVQPKGEGGVPLPMPMYQPDRPCNLFFNESGEEMLRDYVESLAAMGRHLRERAAALNDAGLVVIGLAVVRLQLSVEELAEFWEAVLEADLTAALDAIADRQYVLDGDALMLGLGDLKLPALRAVHAANMRKLGPDGKPIVGNSGRVEKPEGWEGPEKDLEALLANSSSAEETGR